MRAVLTGRVGLPNMRYKVDRIGNNVKTSQQTVCKAGLVWY